MIRNLKALGVALVAVFAFSAVAAMGASAQQGVLTSDGPVTLDITELGTPFSGVNAITAFGSVIECPGTSSTGHEIEETPHTLIPSGATEVTVTPSFGPECHISGSRQAETNLNGCDFAFALGETTPAENNEDTYGVKVSLNCPVAENGIIVTVRSNTPPAAGGSDVCTLEITGGTLNQDVTGLHITDETNGHLGVSGTLNNMHVERTGACVLLGGGTTTNIAELHANSTVTGTDDEGNPTDIGISE